MARARAAYLISHVDASSLGRLYTNQLNIGNGDLMEEVAQFLYTQCFSEKGCSQDQVAVHNWWHLNTALTFPLWSGSIDFLKWKGLKADCWLWGFTPMVFELTKFLQCLSSFTVGTQPSDPCMCSSAEVHVCMAPMHVTLCTTYMPVSGDAM